MSDDARHYGMDWLRIGAFGLLIFYHIGMFFVHWDWHVKTAEPLEWVAIPMLATNAWRLSLLFLVSGYASAALFAKSAGPGAFLKDRSLRLLVPLLFAMALIVPPQPWVELMFKHGYERGYLYFWLHDYFGFEAIDGIVVPTWQHLWFVVYLWAYTLVLALLLLLPKWARAFLRWFGEWALAGDRVVLVPLAAGLLLLWATWPGAEETHDLVNDWLLHAVYLPTFLAGYLLRQAEPMWRGIRRWWRWSLALALVGYAYVAWVEWNWPGFSRPPARIVELFAVARSVQGWCTIVALLGIADRYWNRESPWRATLAEAVFPFYIVHQTIIVVVGWYLLDFGLPPLAEFAILTLATVAGCWLFYRAGRTIMPLRPLIGLRLRRSSDYPRARA